MKKKRKHTKTRRRKKNKLLLGLALIGGSLLLGFGALYYFSPELSIKGVEVVGATTVPQEEVKKAAQELFSSSFNFLGKEITIDNIFVSLEGRANKLLEEFPEIEKVNIKKDYTKGIVYIEVLEKEPVAVWKENGKCSLLDAKGSFVKQCSGQDNFVIIEQKEEIENLNKEEAIKAVLTLKKELEHYDLKAENFSFFADKLVAEDLKGCDFIFSLGDDFDWQIEKMQTILNQEKYLNNLESFQYIELRWGNQAVVKKK